MSEQFFILPVSEHHRIVEAAYLARGFNLEEAQAAAKYAAMATWHGNRTHNAIKALHLDDHFGSAAGGCLPDAAIEVLPSRFAACQVWNANKKLGQATATAAMSEAMRLADQYGIGQVAVDNAFHYLWGGGYVMEAARQGYIAYTHCTAALAEVVPFGGKFPTLGTNPHSWGFPTQQELGYPIVIDWATSVVAMGRVQQLAREGKRLPANAAVDADGRFTEEPSEVAALTTFGGHKGYGLSLINELIAAYIGGSLPTLRSRWQKNPEQNPEQGPKQKQTPAFYFQVIHPQSLEGNDFTGSVSQFENVRRVVHDILGHGNQNCLLPGQLEAIAAGESEKIGGLLFSANEIAALNEIANLTGCSPIDQSDLQEAKVK